jgi:D-glycero-D-manno-heptose 1,7-bisphosphate phosphatase
LKKPAVFIDRDGTINEQMGYINHVSRFHLLSGAAEGIGLLNRSGCLAIVVSNQSGVARGYFPIDLVERVHEHMQGLLEKENAFLDGVFFCPHYERGSVPEYSVACECRKPGTGLIGSACRMFDIDLDRSYVVGDRLSDVEMARRSNLRGILVKTGYGRGEIEYLLPGSPHKPAYIAEGLLHAARWIVEDLNRI